VFISRKICLAIIGHTKGLNKLEENEEGS
jgi:hypothetical protein